MRYILLLILITTTPLLGYRPGRAATKLKLVETLNQKLSDYTLDQVRLPKIPKRERVKEIRFNPRVKLVGPVSFRVITNKQSYHGSCTIIQYHDIYYSTRLIKRGEALSSEDFERRREGIKSHTGAQYLTDIKGVRNMVLRSNLPKGIALMKYHFKIPNMIKNGDFVNIVAKTGHLKVSMPGTAKQNGKAGAYIMVQNRTTQKYLRAQIVAPREVVVFMGR